MGDRAEEIPRRGRDEEERGQTFVDHSALPKAYDTRVACAMRSSPHSNIRHTELRQETDGQTA